MMRSSGHTTRHTQKNRKNLPEPVGEEEKEPPDDPLVAPRRYYADRDQGAHDADYVAHLLPRHEPQHVKIRNTYQLRGSILVLPENIHDDGDAICPFPLAAIQDAAYFTTTMYC